MPEKIYWFQTKSTGQNFEIYWSDLSDLSHVCIPCCEKFNIRIRTGEYATVALLNFRGSCRLGVCESFCEYRGYNSCVCETGKLSYTLFFLSFSQGENFWNPSKRGYF